MHIRILQLTDAKQFRKVRLQALKKDPQSFASSYEEEKDFPLSKYKARLDLSNAVTFGAFDKGELIGIVTFLREEKIKLQHRASILGLYVSEDYRSNGAGKELMKNVLQYAKETNGVEQIYLTVVTTNEVARRLYHSLKFEVIGIDKRALKVENEYLDEANMVYMV